KPGVFALREWDQDTIDKGLADRTPALERLAAAYDGEPEVETEEPVDGAAPAQQVLPLEPEDDIEPDEEEKKRAEFAAGASELFETEEDDDEPILGAAAEEEGD